MFQAPKLTDGGKALYYASLGGEPIRFTTIQLGSGTMTGPIASMTALLEPVVVIPASIFNNNGQYADISGRFSNADLSTGFYWREIGVFAADPKDPDNRAADILYCYQNAYDTADFIPTASVETVEKSITIPVLVGDAENVSCILSKSLIFVTVEDLEARLAEAVSGDIDCGTFEDAEPLALHGSSRAAHPGMLVDGNAVGASAAAETLEEHMADPLAHQNIHLDGNMN